MVFSGVQFDSAKRKTRRIIVHCMMILIRKYLLFVFILFEALCVTARVEVAYDVASS